MSHTKTVLITGANKGIGYAAARQLGALGYTVLLGARSEARGKEAAAKLVSEGYDARHIVIDVTDQGTIDAASKQIADEFGSLDVLVNNAGASFEAFASPSQLELSDLKATYETNFFGVFAVTKAFLPLLTEAPAGRIVNVSSGLGSLTFMSDTAAEYANFNFLAYPSSKTAVNALTIMFAKEFRNTPLKINAADPGYTSTDLTGNQGHRSAEQAAKIITHLATLPEDGPTGGFFNENGVVLW
ncbi:SDR family oxidoreductase [Paenibacillus sp. NPDC057934]|uniref:SDR family oxidoreductase n=1 Tax=Paenibacillus sp. NPDC057934 TaxID=3346282 RepID=UPI0036DC6974